MRVSLFYIKHNKTKNADKFEEHYLKKIKKNMELQIIAVTCKKKFSSKEQQMEYEGNLMRQKIKKEKYICFDKHGEKVTSEIFANIIYKSNENINLFVGGWMVEDSQKYNVNKVLMSVPLIITYLTGPIGLFIYWIIRIFYAKKLNLYE